MILVDTSNSEINLYLEQVLPIRVFNFMIENTAQILSPVDVAGFKLHDFRQSQTLSIRNTIKLLIDFITLPQPRKVFMDDFNETSDHSIRSEIDGTRYLVIGDVSEDSIREGIRETESWRLYGLVFQNDENIIKIYVGAFDHEGCLTIELTGVNAEDIETLESTSFD